MYENQAVKIAKIGKFRRVRKGGRSVRAMLTARIRPNAGTV
jgi:hypothetical protein